MQTLTTGKNYSGVGPNSFNKRQLFEIIKMRQKAGRKVRRSFRLADLDKTPRAALVSEAKRVRTPNPWSDYYINSKIQKYTSNK